MARWGGGLDQIIKRLQALQFNIENLQILNQQWVGRVKSGFCLQKYQLQVLKEFGQIPADKLELKELLYPFCKIYPQKLWSKYRWWRNSKLRILLPTLNFQGKTITVVDRLGAPGDALITANVIRGIKIEYPNLKINCITPNPSLLERDPNIDFLNLKAKHSIPLTQHIGN